MKLDDNTKHSTIKLRLCYSYMTRNSTWWQIRFVDDNVSYSVMCFWYLIASVW